MSTAIRETNATSDTWNTIFAKINTISGLGSGKHVWSAFPEERVKDQSAYPLIVIEPVEFSYDPLTLKDIKRGPVRVSIDVYSTSANENDSVSDSVLDNMETNENDGSFSISGIHSMSLISSPYSQFSRGKLRIHNRTFNYEFDFGWF